MTRYCSLTNNDSEYLDLLLTHPDMDDMLISYKKSDGMWSGVVIANGWTDYPMTEDFVYNVVGSAVVQKRLSSLNFYDIGFE